MCNSDDKKLIALLSGKSVPRWYAGYRFEKEGKRQFRDCLVFYCDGKAKFERYCYGEAAGLVFDVWIDSISTDGIISYKRPYDIAVRPEELPKQITGMPTNDTLISDGNLRIWKLAATLKTDVKNGYSRIKVLRISILNRLLKSRKEEE